ncbi:PaaI family thioesterase [Acetobacteraceae bacterium H6797]|nr:PaaI family thioesterase [Acetobacteraceae bacterium H6797]
MKLIDQVSPGQSGLDTLRALIASGGSLPIADTLGFTFVDVGDGWSGFEGKPGAHAYNPLGTVHGGYAATLLDSACGCAVHSKLGPDQSYTTLELKIPYHRAITVETGLLRAEGRTVTVGRRAAFAEATLEDLNGRLYATATSTLLVMDR